LRGQFCPRKIGTKSRVHHCGLERDRDAELAAQVRTGEMSARELPLLPREFN